MNNYTESEVLKAIREFDENPLHYENVSIETVYIAVDCMREYIINKRKDEHTEKRGHWVRVIDDNYECSECKAALWSREVYPVEKYKFCWSCGAKMDLPEATVKHGEWVERAYGRKQCTCCGKCEDVATDICPNCNAIMSNPEAIKG